MVEIEISEKIIEHHASRSRWAYDDLVWIDEQGEGWALDKKGNRVCICKDYDGVLRGEIPLEKCSNPKQREALEIILEYRREIGQSNTDHTIKSGSKQRAIQVRSFRARPAHHTKLEQGNFRQRKANKANPVH